jgi:hypothetical protein
MLPHRLSFLHAALSAVRSAALPALLPALLPAFLPASPAIPLLAATPPRKPHIVALGSPRTVPYSRSGDPAGAAPGETSLKTRPLLVDGRVSEWTTGDAHDVTDRSFVVRRALRINDTLPTDSAPSNPPQAKTPIPSAAHWVWQRGPWLLVDKLTGRVTALKLPDYDPAASQVAWFRDFAAYCGVTASGKSLFAVVAQLATRKPILAKKLSAFDPADHPWPVCGVPEWQREPLRVTFHPNRGETGQENVSFDVVGSSAKLVEDGDETETSEKP